MKKNLIGLGRTFAYFAYGARRTRTGFLAMLADELRDPLATARREQPIHATQPLVVRPLVHLMWIIGSVELCETLGTQFEKFRTWVARERLFDAWSLK